MVMEANNNIYPFVPPEKKTKKGRKISVRRQMAADIVNYDSAAVVWVDFT